MRWRTALLAATVGVFALVAGLGHAAQPTISITTEEGSTILNAPVIPGAPFQLSGHIDGTVSSDVAIDQVLVSIGSGTGFATIECDEDPCLSGSWVFFPQFPLLPGDYTATATVYDADSATASDDVTVTVL